MLPCRFPQGRHGSTRRGCSFAGAFPPRGRAPRRGCHRRLTTLLVCAPLMIGRTLTDRRVGGVARPAGVISPLYAAMPISKRWRFAIRCRLCSFSQHQRGHKSQAMRRCALRRSLGGTGKSRLVFDLNIVGHVENFFRRNVRLYEERSQTVDGVSCDPGVFNHRHFRISGPEM